MKKTLSLILAMVVTCSLMAGCGGTPAAMPDAPGASGSSAASEAPTVAPGAKGSIEFWTVFTGADGKSMQAIVDAYNATNPDYTVNHRAMEANDLYLKMPMAIQSKQDVPDLCINHVERITAFKDNGFLADMTPYLDKAGIAAANYNPKGWTMTDLDGGHFGIPLDIHTYVGYVNMDLYAQYGGTDLDDGVLTWDEVKAAGERMKGTDNIPIGLAWLRVKFLASYAQLGGTLSTDGTAPSFNNEKAAKVIQNWIDLKDAGYTQKEGDQPWEMFLGGKMLYCPEGQWMYNNVKEAGMNVKMFDYPVFDPAVKGNWSSSHQFVLPVNDARDKEKTLATLKFVDYLGNNSLEWAKAGQTPAHVSIKSVPEFKGMPQEFLASENDELKIYDYKYYGYAVEALDKALGEILWGRTTIEAGLAQAEQETKDRIETEG